MKGGSSKANSSRTEERVIKLLQHFVVSGPAAVGGCCLTRNPLDWSSSSNNVTTLKALADKFKDKRTSNEEPIGVLLVWWIKSRRVAGRDRGARAPGI